MGRQTKKGKKWERRAEERPAALTEAAFELFAERGYAATRLDDVAAACGVSKGTVYLYFESKERLFESVVRQQVSPKLERVSELVDGFEGRTDELLRLLVSQFEKNTAGPLPAMAKLVITESGNFPELARLWAELAFGRIVALVAKVLRRGIARGELRPVNPEDTAVLVLAPIFLMGLWQQSLGKHMEPPFSQQGVLAAHVETLLHGLVVREPIPEEVAP